MQNKEEEKEEGEKRGGSVLLFYWKRMNTVGIDRDEFIYISSQIIIFKYSEHSPCEERLCDHLMGGHKSIVMIAAAAVLRFANQNVYRC